MYMHAMSNSSVSALRHRPEAAAGAPCATRHGDLSPQPFKAAVAHAVLLSVWQRLQALGIFNASLSAGVMNLNVCARTFTSAMVCSILGMWQATHWLPALPGA
jgi:hypothetical protein